MSPPTARVAGHVRRYPWYYAAAVAWAVAMVALPVVHHGGELAGSAASTDGLGGIAATTPPPVAMVDETPLAGFGAADFDDGPPPGVVTAAAPDHEVPAQDDAVEEAPPELPQPEPDTNPGLQLPALPALPMPDPPEQLEPLARAAAPLAATGCSVIGLAGIVIAVVAPTVEDLPLEQLLPYLAPVYSICSLFPIPPARTICPIDREIHAPLPTSITSLLPPPAVMGVGIDTIEGIEAAVAMMTGQTVPSLAEELRTRLGCTVE